MHLAEFDYLIGLVLQFVFWQKRVGEDDEDRRIVLGCHDHSHEAIVSVVVARLEPLPRVVTLLMRFTVTVADLEIVKFIDRKRRGPGPLIIDQVVKQALAPVDHILLILTHLSDHYEARFLLLEMIGVGDLVAEKNLLARFPPVWRLLHKDDGSIQLVHNDIARYQGQNCRLIERCVCRGNHQTEVQFGRNVLILLEPLYLHIG